MFDAVGDNFFEIFGIFLVELRFFFVDVPPCMHERPKQNQSAQKWPYFASIGGLKIDEKKKNLIVLAVTGGRR